ncbi:hypothetical protein ES703_109923 [subsurface metagenome]
MAGEYEETVKKIPVPERAIGPLAGLATRLDYLGPKVEKTEGRLGKLEYALKTLEFPEGVMPQRIELIPFAYKLAALQGVRLEEPAPFGGYIKEVIPHWPDGCNALVDIKVGHGVIQLCPREGYLALNNATPTYSFNEKLQGGETIWVEMRNTDSGNPHNITITVKMEEIGW